MWIDLSAAYHRTHREQLWLMLRKMTGGNDNSKNTVGRWVNGVWAVIRRAAFKVRVRGTLSKEKETTQGNTEGNVLSPSLYIIQIENLATAVQKEAAKNPGTGVHWHGLLVAILLFCDDIAICSRTEDGLRILMEIVKRWLYTDRGVLAATKTCITIFNETPARKRAREQRWTENGAPFYGPSEDGKGRVNIFAVDKFKYVGTVMSWNLSIDAHVKHVFKRVRSAIAGLNAGGAMPDMGYPAMMLVGVYEGVVVSRMTPNSEVWARTEAVVKRVNRRWTRELKRILRVPRMAQVSPERLSWVLQVARLDVRMEYKALRYLWGIMHHRENYRIAEMRWDVWAETPMKGGWGEWVQNVMARWDFWPTMESILSLRSKEEWIQVVNDARDERIQAMREAYMIRLKKTHHDHKLWGLLVEGLHHKERLLLLRPEFGAGTHTQLLRHVCGTAPIHGHDATSVQKRCVLCDAKCRSDTVHYFGLGVYSCKYGKIRRENIWRRAKRDTAMFMTLVGKGLAPEPWPEHEDLTDEEVTMLMIGAWPVSQMKLKIYCKKKANESRLEKAKKLMADMEEYAQEVADKIVEVSQVKRIRLPYGASWRDRSLWDGKGGGDEATKEAEEQ